MSADIIPMVRDIDLGDDLGLASLLAEGLLPDDVAATLQAVEESQVLDGRYVLHDEIGHGSTSRVYAGHDLVWGCSVAIKLLSPGSPRRVGASTDGDGRRFDRAIGSVLNEAKAMSRVADPHVVRVRDVGMKTQAYVVTDLVVDRDPETGTPLYAHAALSTPAASPRDRYEALRWWRDAARGLASAHRQGVRHGDIKPHNLLIRLVHRQALLIDFGLASLDHSVVAGGTPEYMSPEQATVVLALSDGRDPPLIDLTRADIFGLGALGLHLLTGTAPPTVRDGDNHVRLERARDRSVPVRADRAALDQRPLGSRIAKILLKALQPDPLARYETADALAEDVENFLAGMPLADDNFLTRIRLWSSRSVRAIVAMAIVLVGLAVVSVVAWERAKALTEAQAHLDVVTVRNGKMEEKVKVAQKALDDLTVELATKDVKHGKVTEELASRIDGLVHDGLENESTRAALVRHARATELRLQDTEGLLMLAQRDVSRLVGENTDLAASLQKRTKEKDDAVTVATGLRADLDAKLSEVGKLNADLTKTRERLAALETTMKPVDAGATESAGGASGARGAGTATTPNGSSDTAKEATSGAPTAVKPVDGARAIDVQAPQPASH